MSGGLDVLSLKEDDVQKMLAATTHQGSLNLDFQMMQYVYKRTTTGTHIINLKRTWEKLVLAARVIAAVENPLDVFAISSRPYGQRAVLKFAAYTGATPIAGRFTPGAFTNQIQPAFREPRLLVVTDPRDDHQPVTEASYINAPVIAFCNSDSPLKYVDIAIPCNNKSTHSIGLMWWMLSREVLRLKGSLSRDLKWDVMVDVFFYREPEEIEKEEQGKEVQAVKDVEAPAPSFAATTDWSGDVPAAVTSGPVPAQVTSDWSEETAPAPIAPAPVGGYQAAPASDWSAEATTDWDNQPTQTPNWGGSSGWN